MRISDWSSDVCSSDLGAFTDLFDFCGRVDKRLCNRRVIEALVKAGAFDALDDRRSTPFASVGNAMDVAERSEERRVGKECVSTCRSRWSPNHYKKNRGTNKQHNKKEIQHKENI